MLETFRNASKSWLVKLLFALLALSFVAWGVGDVVRQGIFGTSPAIKVGDTALSAGEVNAEFKRDVERMQPLFGGKLTTEDARKMGLLDRTISTIVNRSLIEEAGRRLGLAASDDVILRTIAANPELHDSSGRFDRQRLEMALSRMGLSEEAYMRLERADQVRGQMAEALTGGVVAPKAMVDRIVRRGQEQRVADTVAVADTAVPPPAAPAAAVLEAYYKANTARFMAPEYRAVTVLLLRPADVDGQIQVTDQMIQDAYQQRRAEFNTPERRQVRQVLLDNPADAAKAAALVEAGKDLPAIAKALGRKVVDLGLVDSSELPEELAAKVFALAPGKVAPPVKTALGWHVAEVAGISPGHTRTVADMRGQIEQDIRTEKSGDLLTDLSNKVEDAMGGGASLEEAAKRFHLAVLKFPALDAHGRGLDGQPVAGLPKAQSFLDVAFHSEVNDESQLTENPGDGYFMLRVDSVTPPAPRPLATVKAEVQADWQAAERHTAASRRADTAARDLQAGQPAARVAEAVGGTAGETKPFTRELAAAGPLPPQAVAEMFDKTPGQTAVAATKDGWVAARLERIVPFDPATDRAAVNRTEASLVKSVSGDLVDQFLAALSDKYGVAIDRSQLTREE